ncbi:MAG TPA: acyl-CoA desaturase [Pirellulaceae bacterium]|nr:acyl-CoA desaturase [Pirellulaceae bacterium]
MATVSEPKLKKTSYIEIDSDGTPESGTHFKPPEAPLTEKLIMLSAIVFPAAGTIAAMVLLAQWGFMGWLNLSMFLIGWAATGMGITIGFHRLLTHRSFETYPVIRAFLMFMGALSIEGSPLVWCAVHRRHHALSDQDGDPHSPHLHGKGFMNALRGLWYAQCGWLLTGYWAKPDLKRYVPDLLEEPLLVKVDKFYYLWVLFSLGLPAVIGGLATMTWQGALLGFLWGGLARVFWNHHITWSINSICHVMGKFDYESGDQSRNNPICALLAWGEGWHNNHHAFPTSARHGLEWWQFDSSWVVIKTLEKLGLAWNVRVPSERALNSKRVEEAKA